MAKCQNCGRQLDGLRGLFFIVCKECETSWPTIQKERKVGGAKARLDSILENHIKGETIQVFGLAYWDTVGSTANSIFNKAMGAALLGGVGYQLTGKTHRFGVIAVTKTKLYVIEIGEVVGEEINADKIVNFVGQGKGISFNLEEVILQDESSMASDTLSILEPIQLKATFPSSYDEENGLKATQIASTIDATRKTAQGVSMKSNLPSKTINQSEKIESRGGDIELERKAPDQVLTPMTKQNFETAPGPVCSNCGNVGLPKDKFCRKCGNPIESEMHCNNCGYIVQPNDMYCVKCGSRLGT